MPWQNLDFSNTTIMVIGDFIADEYLYTITSRVSREAPVLIVEQQKQTLRLGGALNVARNVASLGATVIPVGILGDDGMGEALRAMMREQGLSLEGTVVSEQFHTISKTRILAGSLHTSMQQVLRIDRGLKNAVSRDIAYKLQIQCQSQLPRVHGLIFSDYGYGTVTDELIRLVVSHQHQCSHTDTPFIVAADSRFSLKRFKGVFTVTPNEPEVRRFLHRELNNNEELEQAARDLREKLSLQVALITRGRMGMCLLDEKEQLHFIPIFGTDEVTDVTGAGDTVIAVFTTALAAGIPALYAAKAANCAGGMVVTKHGCATVTLPQLQQALMETENN